MKVFSIAAVAALAVTADARQVCSITGDPHYAPWAGGNQKFTAMGVGEFVLAAGEDFAVHTCQDTTSNHNIEKDGVRKQITWVRDIVARDGSNTVEVYAGVFDADTNAYDSPTIVVNDVSYPWDLTNARNNVVDNDQVKVRQTSKGKRLNIKFKATGKSMVVERNHLTNGKWGDRTLLNTDLRVKTEDQAGLTGLCTESKSTKTWNKHTGASEFTNGCGNFRASDEEQVNEVVIEAVDQLITAEQTACPSMVYEARMACANAGQENEQACVFDIVNGCADDAAVLDEVVLADMQEVAEAFYEIEQAQQEFTCPAMSYIKKDAGWPIMDEDDCECVWGYQWNTAGDACVQAEAVTQAVDAQDESTYGRAACFCDATSVFHCSHDSAADRSCVPPVKIDEQQTECDDPTKCWDRTQYVCPRSTQDCSSAKYELVQVQAPALASPQHPFGVQPVFELRKNGVVETVNSETEVRVFIKNVQPEECSCSSSRPCKHNNVADNTCFEKMDLWGDMVCPAGTTECLPTQTNAQLYRKDPTDPSVEQNDKQCTNDAGTNNAKTNFCSGELTCKHQNDGHCMPMSTFYKTPAQLAVVEEPEDTAAAPLTGVLPSRRPSRAGSSPRTPRAT
jgi:hypothetical protein